MICMQNGILRLDKIWKKRGIGKLGTRTIEHLDTIENDGKLCQVMKVLRVNRLKTSILTNSISEIGKFKIVERLVNLNAKDHHTIQLTYYNTIYNLDLIPSPIRDENSKAYLTTEGQRIEIPREDYMRYQGIVRGDPSSAVNIIINQEFLMGSIQTNEHNLRLDTLRAYDGTSPYNRHIIFDEKDIEFELNVANDVVKHESVSTPKKNITYNVMPNNENFIIPEASAQTVYTFDVITDCDEEYYDLYPTTWQSKTAMVIADAEDTMETAADITYNIVDQDCVSDSSTLNTSDAEDLVVQLQLRWKNDPTTREGVQLISGKNNLEDDEENPVVGIAYMLGLDNPELTGYSVVTNVGGSYLQGLLGAHEFGHNLLGDHDDADETWDWGCFCYQQTIMWPTLLSSQIEEFSTDNYNAIRAEAADNL